MDNSVERTDVVKDALFAAAKQCIEAVNGVTIHYNGVATAPLASGITGIEVYLYDSGLAVAKEVLAPYQFQRYHVLQIQLRCPAAASLYAITRRLAIKLASLYQHSTSSLGVNVTVVRQTETPVEAGYEFIVAIEYDFSIKVA